MSGIAYAQASRVPPEIQVRQIDHILLNSDEPAQLFRLFSQKFGLPVAWPFQSYGTFSSGGVGFGNVNIELLQVQDPPSGFIGAALEPSSVSDAVAGLDAQSLKHGAPAPFYFKDSSGKESLAWTTISMTSLRPDGFFFCKYNWDVGERRATIQRDLQNHSGGPLGIESTNRTCNRCQGHRCGST